MTDLFSPLSLGPATVSNRLAVAPMTTTQSNPDGSPSEADFAWLGRLADDGYGTIITAAAAVSPTAKAWPNQLSVEGHELLPGLTRLADCVNRTGALSLVQIFHGGTRTSPELTGVPSGSASVYDLPAIPDFVKPRAFMSDEIAGIVDDFATAAALVAEAGFGGVEVHGANGYLFTQFQSTMTNFRTDSYGGTLENRARLARDTVRAIKERVPAGFVVGFRMSFEGSGMETGLDIDDAIQIMRWLADDGIDYGHISDFGPPRPSQKHPEVTALAHIRAGVGSDLPLMVAGGVDTLEGAQRSLDIGADLVAIGRAAIGNADIPGRFSRDEPLAAAPYASDYLKDLGVGEDFQGYLSRPPMSFMNLVAQ